MLALPLSLFAQSNYRNGYVVKANGDTLKGYINYREWTTSPKTIEFKQNVSDKQLVQFNPADIKGFAITGFETYVSYIGVISMDKNKFPEIPPGLDTTRALDTIFLRQLASGSHLTLYYNSDKIKTRYFVAEAGVPPVELTYHEYYNEVMQAASLAVFKGQLSLYAIKYRPDNDKLKAKIEKANFRAEDLAPIIDLINNTTTAKAKSKKGLFVGLALNYNTLTDVNSINGTNEAATSTTVSPKVSVGFDFFDNQEVQQFVFRVELTLGYINPRFNYPVTVNSSPATLSYQYSQFTTSIVPQLLYNIYNKPNLKVFIGTGMSFNISAYPVNKFTLNSNDPNTNSAAAQQNPEQLQTLWTTVPLQGGITINRKVQLFYIYNITFSSYLHYVRDNFSNHSMDFGVKYIFGGK